jgi:non-ribosomal peptide synthetase component E (peptide arylation enzyme)
VRRSVPAQALIIVRLRVLAPADTGFLVTVRRERRLVFRVRWHRPIISRPAVNVRPCRVVPFVITRTFQEQAMTRPAAIMSSYDHGASNQPLLGETIGENFTRMAMTHADREALVDRFTGRRWTYAELHHDVLALAHGLIRLGIDKGDRVGIWAQNCPEWTVLQYATAEIGAILVPVNPAYRTDELAYVVNQAGIRLLVAAPSFRTSDYATMIEDARPGCPDLRWVGGYIRTSRSRSSIRKPVSPCHAAFPVSCARAGTR